MITWPDQIIHDIARRRAVPFLGSGVSRRSSSVDGRKPPLWKEFLEKAPAEDRKIKRQAATLIKAGDYLTACQILKNSIGDVDWRIYLEQQFRTPVYQPDEIHNHIFRLDLPIVGTTNVDTIYDRFLNSNYAGSVDIKRYHDDDIGRYVKADAKSRLLIKIHGCIGNVDKIVFTKQEYADAYSKYGNFYNLLQSIITMQTIFFIGYSLSDPDINLILEINSRQFSGPRPHYLVTSSKVTPELKKIYEENYTIKILNYSESDDHIDLVESLKDLVGRVNKERDEMADSQIW